VEGSRPRLRSGRLRQAVLGREVGERADDRRVGEARETVFLGGDGAARGEGRRGKGGRDSAGILHDQLEDAHPQPVSRFERRGLDEHPVDFDAVGAHEVVDRPALRAAAQLGVVAGDRDVGEHDLVVAPPPQADPGAGEREGVRSTVDEET